MSAALRRNSPETRESADARLRRLTRVAALLATGATVAIGVVVAKEHPGASATSPSGPGTAQNPTRSGTTTTRGPAPGAVSPPSRTRSGPVVTSGGTRR